MEHPELAGVPQPILEAEAKREAEAKLEAAAKQRAYQRAELPVEGLLEAFLQGKGNAYREIEKMQDLFLRIYRPDLQGELARAKEEIARLREELRAQPQAQVQAAPSSEAIAQALKTHLEPLNARLLDQEALQARIVELTQEVMELKSELLRKSNLEQFVPNMEELQQTLQKAAWAAISKFSDVMPLVTLEGVDKEGAESLMDLANWSVERDLQSACVRQVSRVCVLLARASGPSVHLSVFIKQVNRRLGDNSEKTLQLLTQIEGIYQRLKDLPTAKASLQRLLRLADCKEFDSIVDILHLYADHLEADTLTLFANAVMDFAAQNTATVNDWCTTLLNLPVQWTKDYKEEMQTVLQTVADQGFDSTSRRLVTLLNCYQPADPAPLLAFVINASHLLANPQLAGSVNALLDNVTARVAEARSEQDRDRLFQALLLVKPTSTPEELNQVARLLDQLRPNQSLFQTACTLVDSFARLKDEEAMKRLGLKAMDWLLPAGEQKSRAAFADWLLPLIHGTNSSAQQTQVLTSMIAKLPLDKSLELTVLLTGSSKPLGPHFSTVISSCLTLFDSVDNPVEVAAHVTALLKLNRTEALIQSCTCFTTLRKWKG